MSSVENGLNKSAGLLNKLNQPTKDEKRYLEYFWSPKTKSIRESIPHDVICFFEYESKDPSLKAVVEARVDVDLSSLISKKFLKYPSGKFADADFALDSLGIQYVKDRHPQLIVILDGLLEQTPLWSKIIVGLIGLVASIFGIIEFIHKLYSGEF